MSYFPFAPDDDWTLNININDLVDGIGTFIVDDYNNSISISDATGSTLLAPSGERVWRSVVDDEEVYKLKTEPTYDTTPYDFSYGDDRDGEAISTFGAPNRWVENGTIKNSTIYH